MLNKEQFEEMTGRIRKELDDLAFNLTLKTHLLDGVGNGMFENNAHSFGVTMYIEEEVIEELLDYVDENWTYDDMMENLLDDSKCFDMQGYSFNDYEYFDGIFVYILNKKNKLKEIRFEPCSVNMFDGYMNSSLSKYGHYPHKVTVGVEVLHGMKKYDKFYFRYTITNIVGEKQPKQDNEFGRCRRIK